MYFFVLETRTPLEQEKAYILLVDDSAVVSERLAGMLRETGVPLPLMQARHYGQAIDMMALQKPRIVVLDINLPGRNGLDLLRVIKTKYKGVIVIMLTNQADDYYRKITYRLGADYFLDKSNDFEELPVLLHSLVCL